MRIVFIILGVLLTITLVTVLIINRSRPNAGPTAQTLTVWSPFDEEATYRKISQTFFDSRPTVSFNFRYIDAKDAKDYEAKVVDAIANGQGPDIWLVRSDWLPKHASKSVAAITTGDLDAVTYFKGRQMERVVDSNTVAGQLYGVPMTGDTLAVIYNESLYVEATQALTGDQKTQASKSPASWDDLKDQSALVSRAKGSVITRSAVALGTAGNTLAPSDVLSAFLNQAEASILTEDKKTVALNLSAVKSGQTSFPGTEALSFYTSFAKVGEKNYSWSNNLGDPVRAFLDQKTVSLIGYYSTFQQIMEKTPSFTIKVAPLVQKDLKKERVDFGVTWSHVVNKSSTNPNLAWAYLDYLSDPEVSQQYAEATKRLSVYKRSVQPLTAQLAETNQAATIFWDQLATIKPFIKPEWQTVDEIFQDAIKQVVELNQSPQTSIDSASVRLKDLTVQ